MLRRWILPFICLAMAATFVHSETDLDQIITQCVLESEEFARTENKYVNRRTPAPGEPILDNPPNKKLTSVVYEKEKLQRPFECITERTDRNSIVDLVMNRKYRELVTQCQSNQSQIFCDPSYPYQTFDGTCNNLLFPKYGSVLTCLRRLTEQNYQGAAGFRLSVCGEPLPEPRDLSRRIFIEADRPTRPYSHLVTFYGQFVAHDITDVPVSTIDGKPIDCCSYRNSNLHPQCEPPIHLKMDDEFYSKHNFPCFNFHRAAICDTCSVGKRNQRNQQTAFLDLSLIYGTTDAEASELRTKESGKLKIYDDERSGDLLPRQCPIQNTCPSKRDEFNFISGDRRVNQHTSLTSLHTIFHLEHNRLAGELKTINPHWDDERLFQEARRINIAQHQSIVYSDLLPWIIGQELMTRYNLTVMSGQGRTIYDPFADATMFAVFNTAAFRLHTTINKVVSEYDADLHLFRDTSRNPLPLYHDKLSSLMEGVCLSLAQPYDRFFSGDMTNFLHKEVSGNYGFDIVAVNIHRGRDNGLPTYTEMVRLLSDGTINIQSFDDLKTLMNEENIDILRGAYSHVEDIDLFVGMSTERLKKKCPLGPTAAELIALQFKNIKFGDRFFFEHWGNFGNEQLQTLKKVTMSSILCRNTKIQSIQLNAFMLPSNENPITDCRDIEKLHIDYWRDPIKNI